MATLRSMTGFARLRKVDEQGERIVTVKSVNHRSLDLHVHLPADLDAYEHVLRAVVKRRISRGHVELRLVWNRAGGSGALTLNRTLFESWLAAFQQAREQYGIQATPDLNAALRLPGMLSEGSPEPEAAVEADLVALVEEVLDLFQQSREREGAALRQVILEANERVRQHASAMAKLRDTALPVFQERLREKLGQLLGGALIEPQRLVQEAAILADRSDITEEIHRLLIHSQQLSQLLESGGELGKKLDFLMQEMGRETNTILSKTGGAGETGIQLTNLGIAVKAEIERIREQSLNLE